MKRLKTPAGISAERAAETAWLRGVNGRWTAIIPHLPEPLLVRTLDKRASVARGTAAISRSKHGGQATVCRHSDGINAFFFLPQRPNGAPPTLRGGATRRWTKMAFTLAVELRFRDGSARRLKRKS